MVGFLDTQSTANIVESIYVAYFGRAADGPGYLYWTETYNSEIQNGLSPVTAATNIANSFAAQTEAKALYAYLASPPPVINPNDPVQVAAVTSLVESVYQHLFNRAADTAGLNYWVAQLLGGQVQVGAAIYAIADGAINTAATDDQTVLAAKIAAAQDFTQLTYAANLGTSSPLTPAFVTAAQDSVAPVVDSTTLAASETASAAYANGTQATTNVILTPAADNVTGTSIFGSLTPFSVNGIGPTLNSTDVITGTTPPTGQTPNNTLTVSDDYASAFDDIPVGTTINNIQNVVLNTAGNAGGNALFDTSAYPSVTTTTITSSGSVNDNVRAGPLSSITITHQNTAGGVSTLGGTAVTVNSQGAGAVTIGSTVLANANPTGAVTVNTAASVPSILVKAILTPQPAVTVIGGSTVSVTDSGTTGLITIGASTSSVSSPSEPTGAVVVNAPSGNLTGAAVAVAINGGNGVTVTNSGGAVAIGNQVTPTVLFAPMGNFTVTDTAIAPWETAYVGLGGAISGTPSGFAAPVTTLGGANVSVTTNTGPVTVGGVTVNGNVFSSGQNPTGTVTVADTSNQTPVKVYGGTDVSITAAGDPITVGAAGVAGTSLVEGPSGTVTISNTAPLAYDGLVNQVPEGVSVIAGTAVTVTTNTGGVTVGNINGLAGSEATGAISITDTAANGAVTGTTVNSYGGTTVNITADGQLVTVGNAAIAGVDPSGAVTVAQSAVESGAQYNSAVNVFGGTSVTVNTTGGNVVVGATSAPATGAVAVTDTFVGPNSDAISVVGGTTVNVTTTAISPTAQGFGGATGSITIGNPVVTLNAAGTGLASPTTFPSGNVTVVDESVAGTASAGATNVFGSGAINITANGATTVSVSGGSAVNITDVQTTLATGGSNANKAIGASTLATVNLDGVSGPATIVSDAIANLTVADSSKAASTTVTVTEPSAATVNRALALTLSNDALKGGTSVTDGGASSVTVSTSGTAANEFALNAANATAVTFSNAAPVTLDASALGSVTAITATGAGSLSLGNLTGDTKLASINASAATGAVSVYLDTVSTGFTGGTGSDTVTIDTNPGQDANPAPVISAGSAAVNTVIANYAALGGDSALGLTYRGFTTLGLGANATSAGGNYDASGFNALTVGAVAGPVTFANVAPPTTLTISASPGSPITDILKAGKSTDNILNVTEGVDGSTGTKGVTAGLVLQDGGGNGYINVAVNSVGTGGTATNVLNITDDDATANGAALTSLTLSGDTALTLTYTTAVVGGSNIAVIGAGASTAAVNVTGVQLSAGGASISGGSGVLTAQGVGGVGVNTQAVDSYVTGSGGGKLTLGYGGAWKGGQSAAPNSGYDKGSETVSLSNTTGAADTLIINPGVTANNTSPGVGGVTGFKSVVGSTADILSLTTAHTVLANVGTPVNISAAAGTVPANYAADIIRVDAGVTAGATATAISEMTYKSTDGVIVFGANGSNNVSQFTAQQFITAAEAIVLKAAETTGHEVVAMFSNGGNTYVVASDRAGADVDGDHLYGASVVELVGTTGLSGFGAAGAAGIIDTSNIFEVSAGNNGSATAGNLPYSDSGFSEDNLLNGATGITNTYNNLGAAAQIDVQGGAADLGNLVVTQVGTTGSDSLILNFTSSTKLDSVTETGDGTLLIAIAGNTDIIGGIADTANTTTSISVTGTAGSSLTIGGIGDSALTKFDAHTDAGFLALTVSQPNLTILGALGGDTITANSATDTITIGSATTALTGNVSITANGSGDTFTLTHSTAAATTNSISAASGGDTFTVDSGNNTIAGTIVSVPPHALGNGDTINLLSGAGPGAAANDTVYAGGGATTVNLGTSTAAFGAGGVTDTATIHVTGDLTGALSGGSPAMVTINGAAALGANGTLNIDFNNLNTNNAPLANETWAGFTAAGPGGFPLAIPGSAATALVNVASATSLANALDIAANQATIIDAQHSAAFTQVVNGVLAENGNTGLIDWFQYGGNTYIVDVINNNALNTAGTAAPHTALAATDEVVKLTGLVDLGTVGTATHVNVLHA